MSKQIFSALRIIALALVLSFGISYVYAWTVPTVTPPGGNVSAPINTSATGQYKEGALGIGGLIRGYANAIFDGSVGIGTTSITPWAKLEVNGNVSLTGDDGSGHSLITSEAGGKPLMLKSRAGNYPDLVVGTNGNVGVGVPDPTQKLDVAGNIKGTGLCIGTDCKTAWPASGGVTPPAGSEFLNTSATAQTKAGWLKAVGGNGGDPASRIGVGNNWWMSENPNGNYAIHRNGVGDKLTMDTNGNVGIGTTNPGAKLDVSGQIKSTDGIDVGNAGGAYTYITMRDDESPNGVKYVHANSNVVGFLSGYGGWLSYWDNAGNQQNIGAITTNGLTTTNRLTVGEAGGAYSVVTLKDDESPNGVKYVHANSNVVGFLSGYGGWLSYWDNAGSQYNVGNINANDYYIRASGKWASQLGAGGTPSVGVYQCPQGTGGWNPGGYWGSYGCQGQISSASTCTNIEFPSTQVRNCTYLGTLRIN